MDFCDTTLGMAFLLKKICPTAGRHFVVVMAALRMFTDLLFFKRKKSEWEEHLEEYYAWRKRTYSSTADREKRWVVFFSNTPDANCSHNRLFQIY
jgi:hypothetical protein